jgi:hypothetical protein
MRKIHPREGRGTALFDGYFFFGLVLRSCRSADPATERTALFFEFLSNLPASRPTRLDVVITQLLCRTLPCSSSGLHDPWHGATSGG